MDGWTINHLYIITMQVLLSFPHFILNFVFVLLFVCRAFMSTCASLLPVCGVQGHTLKVFFLADFCLQAFQLLCQLPHSLFCLPTPLHFLIALLHDYLSSTIKEKRGWVI